MRVTVSLESERGELRVVIKINMTHCTLLHCTLLHNDKLRCKPPPLITALNCTQARIGS